MRIALAAGHTQRTNIKERRWEWDLCYDTLGSLLGLVLDNGYEVVTIPHNDYIDLDNNDGLRRKVSTFNEAGTLDLAVELHINAGGGNYSTSIYWNKGRRYSIQGRRVSKAICDQFALTLPWRTIGAKTQGYFGRNLFFLNKIKAPAIIVEPGFKDCPEHREYMDTDQFAALYASMVFNGIEVWRRESK